MIPAPNRFQPKKGKYPPDHDAYKSVVQDESDGEELRELWHRMTGEQLPTRAPARENSWLFALAADISASLQGEPDHPTSISKDPGDRAREGEEANIEEQTQLGKWEPPTEKPVVKKQYGQDWPSYDAAKCNEALLFTDLVIDLALVTQELKPYKGGRRGYLPWEKIVCMAVKAYYKGDLRKTESILKQLAKANVIPRVPDYTSICNFYNDELLTAVLEDLIKVSARPLSQLETVGAMDATGFSTRRYKSWFEYKWGKHEGKERIWMKLHAAMGTKSNVFISAKVTEQNVGDNPMLQPVLGNVTRYFDMKEFCADKAYSSRETLQYLHDLCLEPYIPFRSNASGKSKGHHVWRRMFDHFVNNREQFDAKYHARSNSETCFHMVKARFGERLFTKNLTASINEILIRVLCHNICVLIQESFESGIKIDFTACREMTPPVEKAA